VCHEGSSKKDSRGDDYEQRGVVHLLVPAAHPEKIRKALFTDSEVSNW